MIVCCRPMYVGMFVRMGVCVMCILMYYVIHPYMTDHIREFHIQVCGIAAVAEECKFRNGQSK